MYDIGKFYQAADVEDAVRALVKDPEAVVPFPEEATMLS